MRWPLLAPASHGAVRCDRRRALELLRAGCGDPEAAFRPDQAEAIEHVVDGRGRLLVVQKTGWGKSFVYFIATKLLREARSGPALLVSPLLALMRNQLQAAERMGVCAATVNSTNEAEWDDVAAAVERDAVDILLVSPERLANRIFTERFLAPILPRLALLVIDEAHCISDWGHDFRPHYRLLTRLLARLPVDLRVLATTATANRRVTDDLHDVFGDGLRVVRGGLERPSLALQNLRLPSQAQRLAWLAEHVPRMPGSGIIYALTVRDANLVAEWLRGRGVAVEAYTSESGEARPELERDLLDNRVKALVATTALGMGFDKPDLGFVVHYQTPGSVVAYYQQVGRAGRALPSAYGVLLSGAEDTEIHDHFIDSAFPSRDEVEQILAALHSAKAGLSVPEMMGLANIRKPRIELALELLSLEDPPAVARNDHSWRLTGTAVSAGFWERAERLTRLRHEEKRQMQAYVRLAEGHLAFLIEALDGEPPPPAPPVLPPLPCEPRSDLLRESLSFLRQTHLGFDPRKTWPTGGMPRYGLTGRIDVTHRAREGRALCGWRDAGWGEEVCLGKYEDGWFSDHLVEACGDMLLSERLEPAPTWLTCIPSCRHPELVPDFAERLADYLGLRFLPVLAETGERKEQKCMQNSVQQARNVDGAFAVVGRVDPGPVLLLDDMVDSRWTMTVAAWLLRSHGSGDVYPVALALAGYGA